MSSIVSTGRKGPLGRNGSWTSEQLPGIEVRHCGHPTALRPYYIEGLPIARKFRLLKDAKHAAEQPELYRDD